MFGLANNVRGNNNKLYIGEYERHMDHDAIISDEWRGLVTFGSAVIAISRSREVRYS